MMHIPESTLMTIIDAAQKENRKIIGITLIPSESYASQGICYMFEFQYKETAT